MRTYDQWLTDDGGEPDDGCLCEHPRLDCPLHDPPDEDPDNPNFGDW